MYGVSNAIMSDLASVYRMFTMSIISTKSMSIYQIRSPRLDLRYFSQLLGCCIIAGYGESNSIALAAGRQNYSNTITAANTGNLQCYGRFSKAAMSLIGVVSRCQSINSCLIITPCTVLITCSCKCRLRTAT